jgi:hypothetical protein
VVSLLLAKAKKGTIIAMASKNNKKTSQKSLIYESEQRIIKSGIAQLYECAADKVYFSLKSPGEVDAMQGRSLSVVNAHNYMTINNKYVEASFDGIREKLKINGRHKERYVMLVDPAALVLSCLVWSGLVLSYSEINCLRVYECCHLFVHVTAHCCTLCGRSFSSLSALLPALGQQRCQCLMPC